MAPSTLNAIPCLLTRPARLPQKRPQIPLDITYTPTPHDLDLIQCVLLQKAPPELANIIYHDFLQQITHLHSSHTQPVAPTPRAMSRRQQQAKKRKDVNVEIGYCPTVEDLRLVYGLLRRKLPRRVAKRVWEEVRGDVRCLRGGEGEGGRQGKGGGSGRGWWGGWRGEVV